MPSESLEPSQSWSWVTPESPVRISVVPSSTNSLFLFDAEGSNAMWPVTMWLPEIVGV